MDAISPLVAVAGGLLIGGAAALLLLMTGRIAGVSGIVAAATRIAERPAPPWRDAAAFVLGLPVGAWLVATLARSPEPVVTSSVPLLVAAGLLVGFGTRLGNGCTSGHGVCGVGRLSPRSIAASIIFMTTAIATVFVARHLIGS